MHKYDKRHFDPRVRPFCAQYTLEIFVMKFLTDKLHMYVYAYRPLQECIFVLGVERMFSIEETKKDTSPNTFHRALDMLKVASARE